MIRLYFTWIALLALSDTPYEFSLLVTGDETAQAVMPVSSYNLSLHTHIHTVHLRNVRLLSLNQTVLSSLAA